MPTDSRSENFISAVHIFALCNLVIAQPLFSVLAQSASFFVAHRSKPGDILFLAAILTTGIPFMLVLIWAVIQRVANRAGKIIHAGYIFIFLTTALALVGKRLDGIPAIAVIILSSIAGAALAVLYSRSPALRLFLTALSPAILLVPALFVFFSPVSKLIFPDDRSDVMLKNIGATTPVVMVVLDEFSLVSLMDDDHRIDSIRYPHLARLANDSYWFRNATTVSDITETAVPAILTGRMPDSSSSMLPALHDYPKNLFTLLGGSYDMHVYESITSLCPPELTKNSERPKPWEDRVEGLLRDLRTVYLHILLPADYTRTLPPINQSWKDFSDHSGPGQQIGDMPQKAVVYADTLSSGNNFYPDRKLQFRRFISTIEDKKVPSLYFVHMLLPHVPWEYLPSGKRYVINTTQIPGVIDERWVDNRDAVLDGYQRYLLQVGFVDKMIGALIDTLKSKGLYDKSLVIVTADHGVSFIPGEYRRSLTSRNHAEILPVPLFLKLPFQQESIISDKNVETIDILPTIVEVLKINPPWRFDGVSMLDTQRPERPEKFVVGGAGSKTLHTYRGSPESVDSTAAEKNKIFGSRCPWDIVYDVGEFKNLIGKRLDDIPVVTGDPLTIWLTNSEGYRSVDTSSDFSLSDISGKILNMREQGYVNLAVVVNDTIRAMTHPSATVAGDFSALVPEKTLHAGVNVVNIEVVTGTPEHPSLIKASRPGDIKLIRPQLEGIEYIRYADGRMIPLVPEAIQGQVDTIAIIKNRMLVTGWAVSPKDSVIPKTVIVFINNRAVHIGSPLGIDRWDLVDVHRNNFYLHAGFQFELILPPSLSYSRSDVRVIAILPGGTASELQHPEDVFSFVTGRRYELRGDLKSGKLFLISANADTLKVREQEFDGGLDYFEVVGNKVNVFGWAADRNRKNRVDAIAVFKGDTFITEITTGVNRPDLNAGYGEKIAGDAGFNYSFPPAQIGRIGESNRFRFFALSFNAKIASEINYPSHKRYSSFDLNENEPTSKEIGEKYLIVTDAANGLRYLQSMAGNRIPLVAKALSGFVDVIESFDDNVQVAGWAADTRTFANVSRLTIFHGDKHLYTIATGIEYAQLVPVYRDERMRFAGFNHYFPLSSAGDDSGLSRLRIIAISADGSVASELNRSEPRRSIMSKLSDVSETGTGAAKFVLRMPTNTNRAASLISDDGRVLRIDNTAFDGCIDSMNNIGNAIAVTGWAIDKSRRGPAQSILILSGSAYQHLVLPGTNRPDLINSRDGRFDSHVGFKCYIPTAELNGAQGLSSVKIYAISQDAKYATELMLNGAPMKSASLTEHYSLVRDSVSRSIRFLKLRSDVIPVVDGVIAGSLDECSAAHDTLIVGGWAANTIQRQNVSAIVLFVDGVNVATFETGIPRPDLEKVFRTRKILNAGFRFSLRMPGTIALSDSSEIRIFAVARDKMTVSELSYPLQSKFRH